jgi:4-amino-4-deoxy-L-arabinose transferase-like glycosyltransferase
VKLLDENAGAYTWVAASVGSNSAAGVQLATGEPVMAIGGFNGSDPTPTLAQFQKLVREGKIHYFIGGGRGPGGGGAFGGPASSGTSSQISAWVQRNFTPRTVGGTTIYDVTAVT